MARTRGPARSPKPANSGRNYLGYYRVCSTQCVPCLCTPHTNCSYFYVRPLHGCALLSAQSLSVFNATSITPTTSPRERVCHSQRQKQQQYLLISTGAIDTTPLTFSVCAQLLRRSKMGAMYTLACSPFVLEEDHAHGESKVGRSSFDAVRRCARTSKEKKVLAQKADS